MSNNCIEDFYNLTQKKIIEFSRKAIKKCPKTNKALHCAVLVYRDIIISHGINKEKFNHDLAIGYQHKKVHAEWNCFYRFCRSNYIEDIKNLHLYSLRFSKAGEIKMAKPCQVCSEVIRKYSPRKVFYTNNKGEFEEWTPT